MKRFIEKQIIGKTKPPEVNASSLTRNYLPETPILETGVKEQ